MTSGLLIPLMNQVKTRLLILAMLLCAAPLSAQQSAKGVRLTQKGLELKDQREWKKAILVFDKVIAMEPREAKPYMYRAVCHWKRNNYEAAEMDFNKAVERAPENDEILAKRASFRQKNKDIFGAFDDLDKAITINPKADYLYQHGLMNISMEDEPAAIKDFQKVIEIEKDHLQAHKILAEMRFESGEFPKAINHYSFLVENPSTKKKGLYNRGLCYYNIDDFESCLNDLTSYLDEAPNSFRANKYCAMANRHLSNHEAAISFLTRCIELQPESAKAYMERAYDKQQLDDFDGAMEDVDSAIGMNPADHKSWELRSMIHDDLMETDSALADLRMAIALAPQDADLYIHAGYHYLRKNEIDSARLMAEKVLKYDTKNVFGLMLRSRVEANKGNLAASLEWIDKALETGQLSDDVHKTKAFLLIVNNRFEEAIPSLEAMSKPEDFSLFDFRNFSLKFCNYMLGDKFQGTLLKDGAEHYMDGDGWIYYLLTRIAIEEKNSEAACSHIEEGLEKNFTYHFGSYLEDLKKESCKE